MIKVIKTTADYEAALAEIERLIDLDPKPKTADAEQFELLTLLVQNYELEAFLQSLPDPADAIPFRMEPQALPPRSLIPYFGSSTRVSEVLSSKRPPTLSMIRALH